MRNANPRSGLRLLPRSITTLQDTEKFDKRNQTAYLLKLVACGHRHDANQVLSQQPDLLLQRADVTDYSGRTFKNITAYDYAYWAKDKHACRMLEARMDPTIKSEVLRSCQAIENNGLSYKQNGKLITNSKHYDFTPFKTALEHYVQGYDVWLDTGNWNSIQAAWMMVGQAQCEVPVHVAHEYCRIDRAFHPRPEFDEDYLPENLTIYNYRTEREEVWFPIDTSASSGLGVDFGIIFAGRGSRRCYVVLGPSDDKSGWDYVARLLAWRESAGGDIDLAAISHLDTVRTADLQQSLANLRAEK